MALTDKQKLDAKIAALKKLTEGAKAYKDVLTDIGKIDENINYLQQQLNHATGAMATEIQNQLSNLIDTRKVLISAVHESKKLPVIFKTTGAILAKIPGLIKAGFGQFEGLGLFKMDKALKQSALEMGVLSSQAAGFRKNILASTLGSAKLGKSTIQIGVGIEELAKMQSQYTEGVGRNLLFTEEGVQAMAELSKGTILGAEGASRLASEMNVVGKSAERVHGYIEQTMHDAHKMGLNASKVIKNIQSNIKLVNRFNFRAGTRGLKAMAETASRMGTDMTLVTSMAEKLFDIEGAVEMSAQLQVMGGEWAKLADPFKLMYMARNDINALNEAVINATKGAASFNKQTGEFDIAPLEMQRLRHVAQQAGLDFEQLAVSAKKAAQFSAVRSQIRVGADKETKKYIETVAQFNEKGEAEIVISDKEGTTKRLVKQLSSSDIKRLEAIRKEKEDMRERAKNALSFDESLKNTFTLMKTALFPVIEALNTVLKPAVDSLMDGGSKFRKSVVDFGTTIGKFAFGIASVVKGMVDFVRDNPVKSLILYLGGMGLFKLANWYANGVSLGLGFNSVTGGSGSGILKSAAGFGKIAGAAMAGIAIAGLGAMIGQKLGKGMSESAGYKDTKRGKNWGAMAATAGILIGGAIAAPFTGGASLLGASAMLGAGAGAGALLGGGFGRYFGNKSAYNEGVDDGIFNSTNNRAILQGGMITPIDNKDDLLALKPDGVVDKEIIQKKGDSKNIKIDFGEVKFKFDPIKVVGDNNQQTTIDIGSDSMFIRELTRLIQTEIQKTMNFGKLSPHILT